MGWPRSLSLLAVAAATLAPLAAPVSPAAVAATSDTVERTIGDSRITESSGLSLSRRFTSVFFTHNDKGDGARVFAVGPTGATKAVLTLRGATATDWEDIAAGPRKTVWVGDIGDNSRSRREISVYRFTEPLRLVSQDVPWARFRLAFPDGAHDAEALLVAPDTGRVYVVSKGLTGGSIYRAPSTLSPTGINRLVRVGAAPALVTAGDFARTGERLVLRAYDLAYVYARLGARPRVLRLPSQRQGESITFGSAGTSLLIGTEGASSVIIRVPL